MATQPAAPPARCSEGQLDHEGAQSWLGQYSLALACARRGAKGPHGRNSPRFPAAVLVTACMLALISHGQLPHSCSLGLLQGCGWVGLGKRTACAAGMSRPYDAALCGAAMLAQAQLKTPMANAAVKR